MDCGGGDGAAVGALHRTVMKIEMKKERRKTPATEIRETETGTKR